MPFFGIYVVMFIDVSYTFMKVSVVVLLFIFAFSLGFFVLLSYQQYFSNLMFAIIKTLIMTSGEMEYDNLFFDNQHNPQNENLITVPYMNTTKALFVLFVITMPIIIMNLLVGLAVDDIKLVQENAVLKRIAMQVGLHALFNHFLLIMSKVELVLSVERLLPEFLRERWILKTETLHPNQGPGCLSHISPYQNQLKFIKNLIVASESGAGNKREFHEIKDLAQTISKLQADLKRTNSILQDMAEAQGLDLEN